MKKIMRIFVALLAVTMLLGCEKSENQPEASGQVIHVTNETFETVVMGSDKVVLLDFWASWCGPCQQIAPSLEEIARERTDVLVCKINVDEEPELARQFNVSSIPMLVVISDGRVYPKTGHNASQ